MFVSFVCLSGVRLSWFVRMLCVCMFVCVVCLLVCLFIRLFDRSCLYSFRFVCVCLSFDCLFGCVVASVFVCLR